MIIFKIIRTYIEKIKTNSLKKGANRPHYAPFVNEIKTNGYKNQSAMLVTWYVKGYNVQKLLSASLTA